MDLPYYAFSSHYGCWFCPADMDERAQFVVHSGKLRCFIWDKYDIVEIIEDMLLAEELHTASGDPAVEMMADPEYGFS